MVTVPVSTETFPTFLFLVPILNFLGSLLEGKCVKERQNMVKGYTVCGD